jgi:hypothetical protein
MLWTPLAGQSQLEASKLTDFVEAIFDVQCLQRDQSQPHQTDSPDPQIHESCVLQWHFLYST